MTLRKGVKLEIFKNLGIEMEQKNLIKINRQWDEHKDKQIYHIFKIIISLHSTTYNLQQVQEAQKVFRKTLYFFKWCPNIFYKALKLEANEINVRKS
jgi:hypothetical protein